MYVYHLNITLYFKFSYNFFDFYTFLFRLMSSDTLQVLMFFVLSFLSFAFMNVVILVPININSSVNYSVITMDLKG